MTIGVLSILRASLVFATVAAVACPADAQVVCLGASNTAGKGVSRQEAYPAQLEIMLRARHYDGGVVNAGVSGDTTWGMLNRLESAVPIGTRVVILQPGGNDERHGAASWRDANISQIVERLRARQVAVIMLENQLIGLSAGKDMDRTPNTLPPKDIVCLPLNSSHRLRLPLACRRNERHPLVLNYRTRCFLPISSTDPRYQALDFHH
jgi:acyl-CoA thioesterase-1